MRYTISKFWFQLLPKKRQLTKLHNLKTKIKDNHDEMEHLDQLGCVVESNDASLEMWINIGYYLTYCDIIGVDAKEEIKEILTTYV